MPIFFVFTSYTLAIQTTFMLGFGSILDIYHSLVPVLFEVDLHEFTSAYLF